MFVLYDLTGWLWLRLAGFTSLCKVFQWWSVAQFCRWLWHRCHG